MMHLEVAILNGSMKKDKTSREQEELEANLEMQRAY